MNSLKRSVLVLTSIIILNTFSPSAYAVGGDTPGLISQASSSTSTTQTTDINSGELSPSDAAKVVQSTQEMNDLNSSNYVSSACNYVGSMLYRNAIPIACAAATAGLLQVARNCKDPMTQKFLLVSGVAAVRQIHHALGGDHKVTEAIQDAASYVFGSEQLPAIVANKIELRKQFSTLKEEFEKIKSNPLVPSTNKQAVERIIKDLNERFNNPNNYGNQLSGPNSNESLIALGLKICRLPSTIQPFSADQVDPVTGKTRKQLGIELMNRYEGEAKNVIEQLLETMVRISRGQGELNNDRELFFLLGAPGTGKTELIRDLARASGYHLCEAKLEQNDIRAGRSEIDRCLSQAPHLTSILFLDEADVALNLPTGNKRSPFLNSLIQDILSAKETTFVSDQLSAHMRALGPDVPEVKHNTSKVIVVLAGNKLVNDPTGAFQRRIATIQMPKFSKTKRTEIADKMFNYYLNGFQPLVSLIEKSDKELLNSIIEEDDKKNDGVGILEMVIKDYVRYLSRVHQPTPFTRSTQEPFDILATFRRYEPTPKANSIEGSSERNSPLSSNLSNGQGHGEGHDDDRDDDDSVF